ncbi:MAG: NADH-quinone oxidoreductase subunit N, partial [Devosia nanyangense]|nr:NADH-quinone oxidoreductase subunit N [Devosia nanyangense]
MNSDITSFASLAPAYPEILVVVGALVLLLIGVFSRKPNTVTLSWLAILVLVIAMGLVIWQPAGGILFSGTFVLDGFARFMKVLVLGGSAFALILSFSTQRENGLDKFEYPVLVMLATAGMMMMVSANDLMSLYVGLELQSLALYVVAAIKRDSEKATEAGLKYFVLGALSSGMLLYGASLIYGFTGHTQLDLITAEIAGGGRNIGVIFGVTFLLAGLAF